MESPAANDGLYDTFRVYGLPTAYGENKTAVTVDVLEVGLIFAAVLLAFSYALIIPGIRGKERLYSFIRVTLSLFIFLVIFLVNFGQEWEVAKIHTKTQYKAFTDHEINATIAVKIGLRSVNITLTGDPVYQINERIDYNERFTWSDMWNQGRLGFGPFAGQISQEFRESQFKGLPYPILWIAEYFTLDGELIRWGRSYRQAGFFTHICMWTAFPMFLLANIFFFMVLRYGAYYMILTGAVMLLGNLIYATLRDGPDLQIPFEEGTLTFHYGWCFWLCLIVGLLCIILAAVIIFMDYRFPVQLAAFFNADLLQDFEDTVEEKYSVGEKRPKRISAAAEDDDQSPEAQALNSENGGPMQASPDEDAVYMNVDVKPIYRSRAASRFKVSRRKPRPSPRNVTSADTIAEQDEEENNYDVPPAPRKAPSEHSVKFSKPKTKHGVYEVADMEKEGVATLSLGDVPLSEM